MFGFAIFNCNGLRHINTIQELVNADIMAHVIALQETHWDDIFVTRIKLTGMLDGDVYFISSPESYKDVAFDIKKGLPSMTTLTVG